MRKNSQAALEFLTTYAWAFMVIAITMTSLYYFGILDFSKYLPQKCVFPSQFKCVDFSLQPTQVRLKMANNIGENIVVNSMQITNDATPPISCTPPLSFSWDHSTEKDISFTGCTGGGYLTNKRVDLKIKMIYYSPNTPSRPLHVVSGKINGKVLPS